MEKDPVRVSVGVMPARRIDPVVAVKFIVGVSDVVKVSEFVVVRSMVRLPVSLNVVVMRYVSVRVTEVLADRVLVPMVMVAVCVGVIVAEIDVVSVAVLRNSLMEREADCDWGFCVSDSVASAVDDLLRVAAV